MADLNLPGYLITKLTHDLSSKGTPQESVTRLQDCIQSTVRPPDTNLIHNTAQQALARPLTDKETHDLAVLAWLVEFLYASIRLGRELIASSATSTCTDDLHDPLPWHHRPDIGLTAVNDACLLRTSVPILLRLEMREHVAYAAFLDLFAQTRDRVEMGVLGREANGSGSVSKTGDCSGVTQKEAVHEEDALCRISLPVMLALEYTGIGAGLEGSDGAERG